MRKITAKRSRILDFRVEEPNAEDVSKLRRVNIQLRKQVREREPAEAALRLSEEKYRTLVENSIDLIYTVSLDGKIGSLNPAFEEITGWSPDQWIGQDYAPLVHPDDLHLLLDRRKKILLGEKLQPAEARIRTRSGEYRIVEFNTVVQRQGDAIVGLLGTARDITNRRKVEEDLRKAHDELEIRVRERTAELARANCALRTEIRERRRAEKALRLDEMRLEALFQLSQMTWASEEEVANYVLEQQIRLTSSTIGLIGFLDEDERLLDLHTWTTEPIPECGLPDAPVRYEIASSGLWADAVRKRMPVLVNDSATLESGGKGLPCGNIPLTRLLSIPVFDNSRIIAVAIVANKYEDYDQSDVVQLTLLLDGMWKLMLRDRSVKALRDAENLAAIGRALSGVAHDMKTPLIAIGGFARLVQGHIERNSPDWDKMAIILKETRRLEQMVGNMLDFSRPLELAKSPEDIYRLIQESLELAKPVADKKQVTLIVESGHPIELVPLDGARVKQAILNLMTNAIEVTPEGKSVNINCRKKDSRLIVEVSDCGCGIPLRQRKEIFLPFFTTKKEGTGLGLPIVKKIAEAHNGRVEISDNPESGVTFRLVLPAR